MAETTEQYKARIAQIKSSIVNEPYIKKMRDDIAEGISKTGNRQADLENDHEAFKSDLGTQFKNLIDETTGKDVISAPEIIAARKGEASLNARLTKNEQETTAQFQQTTAQLTQTLQVGRINKSDNHKINANQTMVAKVNTGAVNLMGSQDVSSNWYSKNGVTLGESIEVDRVVLTKIKSKNFYDSLRSNRKKPENTLPLVLDSAKKYLCSAYCLTYGSPRFFYHTDATSGVNDSVYVDNQLRRFWFVVNGTDDVKWYVQGNSGYNVSGTSYENEIYLGGFQVEEITDYKNGIISIGDSTFQGSAGTNDNMNNTEIPKMFGSLLNASFFNRAIGGNTTQQMINRWSTDITPLAPKSKYVLIQGGINNLGKSGTTAESILSDHKTMHSLALQDGLVPIHANLTPCGKAGLDEEIRVKANELLSTEYGDSLLDISKIVGDPYEKNKLLQIEGWKGDGVHYGQGAKDAVSDYIASRNFWELAKPSQFKKQ